MDASKTGKALSMMCSWKVVAFEMATSLSLKKTFPTHVLQISELLRYRQ